MTVSLTEPIRPFVITGLLETVMLVEMQPGSTRTKLIPA
jgi:hypothetical protein